jgi:outer membrane protein assembly factor BamB
MLAAMQKTGKLFIYNRTAIGSGPMQTIQVTVGSSSGNFIGLPAYNPVLKQIYLGSPTDSGGGPYKHGLIAMSVQANCSLSLAWQTQVGLNASSYDNPMIPPTVANGVVYYADGDLNEVFAFNAQNGNVLWRFSPVQSHGIFAAPTVVNGQVFVGAFDHQLYAFGL